MKYIDDPVECLILALEAALVVLALALGNGTRTAMGCYWAVITVNHLAAFIHARNLRKKGQDDGKQDD